MIELCLGDLEKEQSPEVSWCKDVLAAEDTTATSGIRLPV